MTSERVYAVWEYYDGVRTGVANFMGEPYVFAQEWSEAQQAYLPTYSLTPITKQALSLVLEQWRIFRAWEIAFHSGKVEASTHPGLLGQDARYAEINLLLKATLEEPRDDRRFAEGNFTPVPNQGSVPKGVMREIQVEWHHAA